MKWYPLAAALAISMTGLPHPHNPASGSEHGPAHTLGSSPNITNVSSSPASPRAEAEEEKLTITKIMKLAHKSGLLKKVATGKATDPEIADLHRFYLAMPTLTPPKGEAESWEKKTAALTKASKAAVDKAPNANALLKSATDCAACHKVHK